MTGRRSFLSLAASLFLHGLAGAAVLALASRESVPGAVIVELGEAVRVGDAGSAPGLSGSNGSSAPVAERKSRPLRSASARRAVPRPAESVSEPESVSQPELSAETAQPSRSQQQAGSGAFEESIATGIPGSGPLAMLTPSGVGGERGAGSGVATLGTGGGERGIPAEFGPYLAHLRQRIQEALNYPVSARRRGLVGTVQLEIDLLPSGKVASVIVMSSSSHEVLDEAALETVRRLQPDPFPPGLSSRPLRVRVPIVFELQ